MTTAQITRIGDFVHVQHPNEKSASIWSLDMWGVSVIEPVKSGSLPHMARNTDDPPEVFRRIELLEWKGGDVVWSDVEYDGAWWTDFTDQVHANQLNFGKEET